MTREQTELLNSLTSDNRAEILGALEILKEWRTDSRLRQFLIFAWLPSHPSDGDIDLPPDELADKTLSATINMVSEGHFNVWQKMAKIDGNDEWDSQIKYEWGDFYSEICIKWRQ